MGACCCGVACVVVGDSASEEWIEPWLPNSHKLDNPCDSDAGSGVFNTPETNSLSEETTYYQKVR